MAAGGLPVLEVTLRTPASLEALRVMAAEVEGAVVGAGTVLDPAQGEAAVAAGARFLVSPGVTPDLMRAAASGGLGAVLLPGAATASEVMSLRAAGIVWQKFFPAEPSGGVGALRALAAPIPDVTFCPTGGVTPANAAAYLALPNVACVGGSWVAPADAVRAGDWRRITALAAEAARLPGG